MIFKMVVDGKQVIPCAEQLISEVIYTARTLSKFGGCKVDVYDRDQYVNSYLLGRAVGSKS